MTLSPVALVRYAEPLSSLREAVELCDGLRELRPGASVLIKPNVCFWYRNVPFPKWGVITTSRIIEDAVRLLREHGAGRITIAEGMVLRQPGDTDTTAEAFESLGYTALARKYDVEIADVHVRPFRKVNIGDGIELRFNVDALDSDFVVNIPVLKTHVQAMVSLGTKNLKGLLDVHSRQKCHSAHHARDLDWMLSRLGALLPASLTIIDGIFTNERGPSIDGTIHRGDLLVASRDLLAADKVGAAVLGFDPAAVPHLAHAASARNRPADLSDVAVRGMTVDAAARPHAYRPAYDPNAELPAPLAELGLRGLRIPEFDSTVCTYCTTLLPLFQQALVSAWRGTPWNNVEILTGKRMQATPGRRSILVGSCMCRANKGCDGAIEVRGCPPRAADVIEALGKAGIEVSPYAAQIAAGSVAFLMRKYAGKPQFDESLFRVEE